MAGILLWTIGMLLLGLCLLIAGIVLRKKGNPYSPWVRLAAVIIIGVACFLVVLSAVALR